MIVTFFAASAVANSTCPKPLNFPSSNDEKRTSTTSPASLKKFSLQIILLDDDHILKLKIVFYSMMYSQISSFNTKWQVANKQCLWTSSLRSNWRFWLNHCRWKITSATWEVTITNTNNNNDKSGATKFKMWQEKREKRNRNVQLSSQILSRV